MAGGFGSLHTPLPLACRLVRVLGAMRPQVWAGFMSVSFRAMKAPGRSPSTKLTSSSTQRKRSTPRDNAYEHRDSRHHKALSDRPIDSVLIQVARVRHTFCSELFRMSEEDKHDDKGVFPPSA